jgi:oligoribonuclease NrnB/cAMP/cGMP phosphodiesterase (DHH superfamily)
MKFTIFAHSHCTDGLVAASIMKYSLQMNYPSEPEVIFVSYGKEKEALEKANINSETIVYCVDFSFNKETTLELCSKADKVYVLDHHKTAYENLEDLNSHYNFYFTYDVNKSGASIVRDFCKQHLKLYSHIKLNQKEVLNKVVAMVEDRDLWLFRLPMTREFSEYIFAYIQPNDINKMTEILFKYKFAQINTLCQLGSTIMYYKDQLIEKKLKSYNPIYINFGSTRMLIINETQPDLVSSLGNALCKQYDIPVCLYNISGSYDGVISVALSFRSIDHLEPVDSVARLFSGGGHRNASGCSVSIDKFNELLCQF